MTECHINTLNVKRNRILIFLFKGISCQVIHLAIILDKLCLNFQFSNTLRKIEMVAVKVWSLYVHIVAQVNHKGSRGEGRNKLSER